MATILLPCLEFLVIKLTLVCNRCLWDYTKNTHLVDSLKPNHKMIEVGRDSGGHLLQPPCSSRTEQSRLLRWMSRWLLNISEKWDTISLGYPFHCSVTFRSRKYFLTFRQNLLCSNLLLLASCIVTRLDWKELGSNIFELSHQVTTDIDKTPGDFFSPKLYGSNYLSLSSQQRFSSSSVLFVLHCTLYNFFISLLFWGSRTGHSPPGEFSPQKVYKTHINQNLGLRC